MPRPDVVVVGGGLGGLTCAAFLARQDVDVVLVERNERLGGLARSVKVGEHLVPANLARTEGFDDADPKKRILEHLGVLDRVRARPSPTICEIRVDDGFRLTLPAGFGPLREKLAEAFPEDAGRIAKVLDSFERLPAEVERLGDTSRAALLRFVGFPFFFPTLFRFRRKLAGPYLRSHLKSRRARLALAALAPLVATSAEPLSAIVYGIAAASAFRSPVTIQGGARTLVNALGEVAGARGASVRLGVPAEAILVDGRAARGVRTAAEEIRARVVVSNAPPHVTFGRLLPREALYASFLQRLGLMRESASACALVLVLRGARSELETPADLVLLHAGEDLAAHGRAVEEDGVAGRTIAVALHAGEAAADGLPRTYLTAVVSDLAARWRSLDDAAREALAGETAETILERLKLLGPDVRSRVESQRLVTPLELAEWSGEPGGCRFGFEQTPGQSGNDRLAALTPVDDLILAGAWTYPGGGLSGTVISGFLAALQTAMALGVRVRM